MTAKLAAGNGFIAALDQSGGSTPKALAGYGQQAQMATDWGMRVNGQNKPTVGQFQKGNKLQGEWEQTMANANSQQRGQAICWESFGFAPIKDIIKSNILQFAPTGDRFNSKTKTTVTIDIAKLREAEGAFEVGDGLLPIERLMHSDVAGEAFSAMSQNPAIGSGYELSPMFSYLMGLRGVDKLKQFEKDPTILAYNQELSQWLSAALELGKSIKDPKATKDMVEMLLGPKPVDPRIEQQKEQQQQQTTQQTGEPNAGA